MNFESTTVSCAYPRGRRARLSSERVEYSGPTSGAIAHGPGIFLLAYIEQQNLANQLHYNLDWKDPANATAIATVVKTFVCPSAPSASGRLDTGAKPATRHESFPVCAFGLRCLQTASMDFWASLPIR